MNGPEVQATEIHGPQADQRMKRSTVLVGSSLQLPSGRADSTVPAGDWINDGDTFLPTQRYPRGQIAQSTQPFDFKTVAIQKLAASCALGQLMHELDDLIGIGTSVRP